MFDLHKIFSCTRCGYCCHGETTVSLDANDQDRMCHALNMEREQVSAKYWRITGDVVQMKIENSHCIFYDEGCCVHEGRPWRCAEWPLHPSILEDQSNFSAISESCPGINKELSYEEFCEILKKILSESQRIHC